MTLGFDPRFRYAWSLTALQSAVRVALKSGNTDIVKHLLNHGVAVDAPGPWLESYFAYCTMGFNHGPIFTSDFGARTALQDAVEANVCL